MIKPLSFVLLCSLFAFSCSSDEEKYFRKITTNGKLEFIGLYPIAKQLARTANCYKFIYSHGKVSEIHHLQNGRIHFGDEGFARVRIQYFDGGVLVTEQDEFGLELEISGLYNHRIITLNERGLPAYINYLDRQRHPVGHDEFWRIRVETDESGIINKKWYEDIQGNPALHENEIYGVEIEYNEHQLPVKEKFLNKDGMVMENKQGAAYIIHEYDDMLNEIELRYLSKKEMPVEVIDGVASMKWAYDKRGYKIETVYYNRLGEIVNATQGIAINTFQYNDQGLLTSCSYYDSARSLVYFDNYAKIDFFYDKKGNRRKVNLFKIRDGQLYLEGSEVMSYDDIGHLVSITAYDEKNRIREIDGVATQVYHYDFAHNQTLFQTLNAVGDPVPFTGNVWRTRWSYNESGDKIETRYYDVNGNLTGGLQHEAINRFEYDECGNLLSVSYYDSLERPIEFNGAARIELRFNDREQVIDELRFDRDGKLISKPQAPDQQV